MDIVKKHMLPSRQGARKPFLQHCSSAMETSAVNRSLPTQEILENKDVRNLQEKRHPRRCCPRKYKLGLSL